MNNRLPPAFSKHLKAPGPKASPLPKAKPLPPVQSDDMLLRMALELQQAKKFPEAEDLCLRVLARTPNHHLALYILGTLGLGFDDEQAIRYFARAAAQQPNNPYYQLSLGEACLEVGDYPLAVKHLQRACELKPDLGEALYGLGEAYTGFEKADMALPVYKKVLGISPNQPAIRKDLAIALINLGRMDEATVYLKEAVDQRLDVSGAYRMLVSIRKFSAEPPELRSILDELANPAISADEAYELHQAAGKVLSDLGRYDESMGHFLTAKRVQAYDFDIGSYRERVDALIDLFSPEFLAAKAGYGDPSETPVFVVGMPRSGTTLTEQICSSHPDVHGAGELTKLKRISTAYGLRQESTGNFGQPVRSMTAAQAKASAMDYLVNLRLYSPTAPRVVDKMPHNFELVGLIAILFPNARIIHCRRDAIDNCVSCFVSHFGEAHRYTADLDILGQYYREYYRLMRHWQTVLPGRIFENRYEDLISDQEGQSRRLIDHLGLPWDDACLRFFDKAGSVRTLSRWQVRQPIYTSSVNRWKNYEGKIQPLIDALGDLADL